MPQFKAASERISPIASGQASGLLNNLGKGNEIERRKAP
jgi:hypothetical protein